MQQEPPKILTQNFIPMLTEMMCQRQGVYQLVQFYHKRNKIYVGYINDGYFRLRVFFGNKAADLIQSGNLKVFSIISSKIQNRGSGAIFVKNINNYWDYHQMVGCYKDWKKGKANVNSFGNNIIQWNIISQISRKTAEFYTFGTTQSIQIIETKFNQNKQQKTSSLEISFSKLLDLSIQKNQQLKISNTVNQQANKLSQQVNQVNQQPNTIKQQLQQNNQSAAKSQQSFFDELINIHLAKIQKFSQDKKEAIENIDKYQKQETIVINRKQSDSSQSESSSKSQLNLEWALKQLNKYQQNQEIIKNTNNLDLQACRFHNLLDQSQDNQQISNQLDSKQILNSSSSFKENQQLLIPQLHYKLSKKWWIRIKIICKGQIQNINSIYSFCCILKGINQNLIQAKFINIDSNILQEDKFYKISGGYIINSSSHKYRGSQIDLEFIGNYNNSNSKSNKFLYQQCQPFLEQPNGFNYCSLTNIQVLPSQTLVNIIALLSDISVNKTKMGKFIIKYQIYDPIQKIQISMIQFSQFNKLINLDISNLKNKLISIYNAKVNQYQGKKSLMTKINTILRYDWGEDIPLVRKIKQILLTGQDIQCCISQGLYAKKNNIRQSMNSSEKEIMIGNVQLIEFGRNYQYTACDICMKKIGTMGCKSCGYKSNAIQRVFIRGMLADSTGILQVIWGDRQAQKMLQNGFQEMCKKWLLQNIQIWIIKNKQIYNVQKIKLKDAKFYSKSLLTQIKELLR